MLIHSGIGSHKTWKMEILKDQAISKDMQDTRDLLRRLDSMKNRGLYADHTGTRTITPDDISLIELNEVMDLADALIGLTSYTLDRQRTKSQRHAMAVEMRKRARLVRRLEKSSELVPRANLKFSKNSPGNK